MRLLETCVANLFRFAGLYPLSLKNLMNLITCFQESVVDEHILHMSINCDFGRAFMVFGGWFDLALKYWNVSDGLE